MPLLMCPNCNTSMSTVNRQGVEFDMCPTCRGVWLDRGELEKLVAADSDPQPFDRDQRPRPIPRDVGPRRDYDDDDDDYRGGRRRRGRFDIFDMFD
jgi:uncharacterized protein